MPKLLFLAHRMPYPPNKGERIRAFYPLKHLAGRHEIWLGALADSRAEIERAAELGSWCKEVHLALQPSSQRALGMAFGSVSGRALSVSAFANRELKSWCTRTIADVKPDVVYLVSSAMAQYVMDSPRAANIVMDFVDADSAKFRQYASERSGPMRLVYRIEADRVERFDRAVARAAKACIFVSNTDRNLFARACPESSTKLHVVPNGVDCNYFDPALLPQKERADPVILFTGTMDYYPNVDAVSWFARAIFPQIRAAIPNARFQIVGTSPAQAVQALTQQSGIEVTGAVPDIRPYYADAAVCVAPLRIARGIQNKVLEAMAMAKPMIASPNALDGISATAGEHVLVAGNEADFAKATIKVLREGAGAMGPKARANVLAHHAWSVQLAKLDAIIDAAGSST